MEEFAAWLGRTVLERPVVDQTGIAGRYDFVLKWLPDDSRFGGHPPTVATAESTLPSLFEAMQQQVGLRLMR